MFSYLDRFHVKFNALSSLHDRGELLNNLRFLNFLEGDHRATVK